MSLPAIDTTSNYYITTAEGGWSPCIEGNNAHGLRPFTGSVLPNCVGFAVGRFNEIIGAGNCDYLGNMDAKYLYNYAISQGLESGTDPLEGALMVWDDSDNEGHAAIVEQVFTRRIVLAYESGWNYTAEPIVRSITRIKGLGTWGESSATRSFLGFIYLPGILPPNRDPDAWYIYFHEKGGIIL